MKKIGVTVLVSSQTAVKDGHGFEIAVRMDNLRDGDSGKIQNRAHRVRSMHPRSSLFSVVFKNLISPAQKLKLEKNTLNTSKTGSFQPICGIIIVNKSFSSAKAAVVVLFALVGRTAAILDVAMLQS